MKKKLPIGIQSFKEIRSGPYYYVDKTPFVARLVDEGKYYFLCRPRRFGKSLFLDTLKQAFLGRRELFEGLYLERNWDWGKSYPVIHLDFAGGVVKEARELEDWILHQLKLNQKNLSIKCEDTHDYRTCFEELIIRAYEAYQEKVVVLIDEYDKPILDCIEERERARKLRDILKNLYSVLKPLDSYLRFVFITGVSKFSKVSLFSGLNQLQDITLSPRYATICGYTQEELEGVFSEELEGEDLEAIRCWYNGYSFCGESVYNPFDVLLYLSERKFRAYWFETGTPTFLVKLLMERGFYLPRMEGFRASERLLGSFDVDHIEPETLLFQAGYLTVKKCENTIRGVLYHLGYPNKEVKVSLNEYLFVCLTEVRGDEEEELIGGAEEALREGRLEDFKRILRSLFAGIPYEWHKKAELSRYEGYYASVVYSFLVGTGLEVIAEDYTSKGRIDLTIKVEDKVYIIEFKVMEGDEARALEVLRSKEYEEKYRAQAGEIYLVGIDFDLKERNITRFEWVKVSQR